MEEESKSNSTGLEPELPSSRKTVPGGSCLRKEGSLGLLVS